MSRIGQQASEVLFGGGVALVCDGDGQMAADAMHGLFAGDTRVLSTWRFTIAGHSWQTLSRARSGPSTFLWNYQNRPILASGTQLPEGSVGLRLRRRVDGVLHDCLHVRTYHSRHLPLRLVLLLDADFADLFEVKDQSMPPRLNVARQAREECVRLEYRRADFHRGLDIAIRASHGDVSLVGSQIVFDVGFDPGAEWTCCLEIAPVLGSRRLAPASDPHAPEPAAGEDSRPVLTCAPRLKRPFEVSCRDLERLVGLTDPEHASSSVMAAGAPWFLALFGRDLLVTVLMTGLLGPAVAKTALAALGALQARENDPERDAQPGKLPHELRHGELAHTGAIPHRPYYGSHDAPALYVLALWHAYRWSGDRALLDSWMPVAERALAWCEERGDSDRDGFLEYRTLSPRGYRNQGWKDAEDAIPHEDGQLAEPPIATIEIQGYLYAARLAMAELHRARGDEEAGERMDRLARDLRRAVEERFWMEEAGWYALALDRDKRAVKSIASNPGHLLWAGLPAPERARRLARRMLAPGLFSGWGLRTLSAEHRRYNPMSYQTGSVWPHDTALAAAGLARYGLHAASFRLLRALVAAASRFEDSRLPELFCGFGRKEGPPVPYAKANRPQAWSSAVPVLAVETFLGLVPDVPNGRCHLAPRLPNWLPELAITGIALGDAELEVHVRREGLRTRVVHAHHPSLEVHVGDLPEAPLRGAVSAP